MLQIRTTINSDYVYLDLYKNEPVFLSLSFAELQDITKKNSNFSKSFSLPGSKNNNATFNFFYDLNSVPTTFNPNNKFEAELLWDGYEIMRGYIRLNSVAISNGEIIYSVTFYNQIGDLMANIGDNFLFDLNLDYLSHPYSEQVILESQLDPNLFPLTGTTNYSYQNGKTMWGLFNIGYNYISGNTVFAQTTPLVQFTPVLNGDTYIPVSGNFDFSGTPVRDSYYKPAIQVKELYEQIVREAGYVVESNFFETAYFKNYYLPLKFADETIYSKNAIPPCYTVTADSVTAEVYLAMVVNQSTGVTCNTLGWSASTVYPYPLTIPSGNTGVYTFRFTFSARPNLPCPSGSSNNLSFYFEDPLNTVQLYSNIFCDTGNTTTVSFDQQFIFTGQSTFDFFFSSTNVEVTNYKQEIIDGPRFIPTGAMIDYSIEFPINDYKQLDFITSVNKYFNLVVVPNPDKPSNLIVEPIIDYIGTGEVLDWTTKVDFDQTQNLYPTTALVNGTLEYSFKLDQDYTNQDFQSQANRIFGTDKFLLNLQYKDATTKFDYIFSSPIDITVNNAFVPLITIPSMSKLKQIDISGATQQTFVPFKILPKLLYRGVTLPNDNYGYFGTTGYTENPDCVTSVSITVNTAGYVQYYTCTNQQFVDFYDVGSYVLINQDCILSYTVGPSYAYPPYANLTVTSIGSSCTPENLYSNYQYYYMNNTQMDRWTNINRFTTYPFNYLNFSHYTNFRGEDKTNVTPQEYSFVADDLYNVYYEDYVQDIISEENKIYSCKIYLYPQDIQKLRWNERILINNTYFRINKITNFNALEPAICDVELVKLTKTYNPHAVKYYKFESCPCTCRSYTVTNNSMIGQATIQWVDCYGVGQEDVLNPNTGQSFCACEGTVIAGLGDDVTINLIGSCTPDPPAPSGTTVYYSNSDLMYHAYAYVGNKVKLYDDSLNYLGCFGVSLDTYNPLHDYQHYYFTSAYTANLVGVYSDCNCTNRTQFIIVQEEPAVTPYFYYLGYDCSGLTIEYQFKSTGSTLSPSSVYKIYNSGTSQTVCVTNIIPDYLQPTDWVEIDVYNDCEICNIPPTPTPTPTPVYCTCWSYTVVNNSLLDSASISWTNCDNTPGGTTLNPQTGVSICACQGSVTVETIGSDVTITDMGACGGPEPTPTPTPSCASKGWLINTCANTCSGGICTCTFGSSIVVYSNCTVTDVTDPGTLLYTNSSLTTPYVGFFNKYGSIWYSDGGVTEECVIGGPC